MLLANEKNLAPQAEGAPVQLGASRELVPELHVWSHATTVTRAVAAARRNTAGSSARPLFELPTSPNMTARPRAARAWSRAATPR